MEKIKIELNGYKKGDEKALIDVYNEVFDKKRTQDYWDWKYRGCPAGFKINLAKNSKGKIVGQHCYQIRKGWYFDKEYLFSSGSDACIFKKYKNQGFFTKSLDSFPLRKPFISYGFPELKTLNSNYYDREYIVKKPYSLLNYKAGFLDRFYFLKKNNLEIRKFDSEFPKLVDKFWTKKKHELNVSIVRDWKYLKWRLVENPHKPKIYYFLKNGEFVGYFAIVVKGKQGFLIDFCVFNDLIDSSICAIKKILKLHTFKSINFMTASNSLVFDKFLKNGFFQITESFLVYGNFIDEKLHFNFYLTYTDTDIF